MITTLLIGAGVIGFVIAEELQVNGPAFAKVFALAFGFSCFVFGMLHVFTGAVYG